MSTAVVTLTDQNYFERAKRTIVDCRTRGEWKGPIILITIAFDAPKNWLDFYGVTGKRFEHIDTSSLVEQYKLHPFVTPHDGRNLSKLTQWDKFHVFDEYFLQWKKVIFLDAGLGVFDSIQHLNELECDGKLIAPDDAPPYDEKKRFFLMLEFGANAEAEKGLFEEYSRDILQERYFLNCMWVYDTQLIKKCAVSDLVSAMNKFPICRCNEMTIMNLLFSYKHKVWSPMPQFASSGKRLFGWCEYDRDYGTANTWRDFCFMKYPVSINMNRE